MDTFDLNYFSNEIKNIDFTVGVTYFVNLYYREKNGDYRFAYFILFTTSSLYNKHDLIASLV